MLLLLPIGAAMIVSAMLIAPIGLYDVARSLAIFTGISLVVVPVVGWQSFLIRFAFSTPGSSRLAAVVRLWVEGSLLVAAVFTLLMNVVEYYPSRPGPSPRLGFLLADVSVSTLVSCGIWGALSPTLPREIALRGALISGCVLSVVVALLGYMLAG